MSQSSTDHYDNILNQCIEAIRQGDRQLLDCLSAYPDYAEQLKIDLTLSEALAQIPRETFDSTKKQNLENLLLNTFDQVQAEKNRVIPFAIPKGLRRWVAVLVFMLVFVMAGGGTIKASENSLPGDSLYGVKRFWEQVILLFSTLFDQDDIVWIHLAEVRFYEMQFLSAGGRLSDVELEDFIHTLDEAIQHADKAESQALLISFIEITDIRIQTLSVKAEDLESLHAVKSRLDQHLEARDDIKPPTTDLISEPYSTASPTPTFIVTLSPTSTVSPSVSMTPMASETALPLLNVTDITATLRIPATATRTQTPVIMDSPTATYTLSPTVTASYTPLAIQEPPPSQGLVSKTPIPTRVIRATATPSGYNEIFIRETQNAIYMTQTAQAKP